MRRRGSKHGGLQCLRDARDELESVLVLQNRGQFGQSGHLVQHSGSFIRCESDAGNGDVVAKCLKERVRVDDHALLLQQREHQGNDVLANEDEERG